MKLRKGKINLIIKKNFLTVTNWNNCPSKMVDTLPLSIFKTRQIGQNAGNCKLRLHCAPTGRWAI